MRSFYRVRSAHGHLCALSVCACVLERGYVCERESKRESMCETVCVCERDRVGEGGRWNERERERKRESSKHDTAV